jgi:predicted metal-dependent peptidase
VNATELEQHEARRLASLRLELLDDHPFWGHLLLHVRLVAAPRLLAFAATDCVRHIWYNPQYTRHLDMRQLGFVLAHEIGHHVFESLGRRDSRDLHLWNCATDYAINRMVAGITRGRGEPMYRLPDGSYPEVGEVKVLYDARFAGMTAEQIYDRLVKETPPPQRTLHLQLPGEQGEGSQVADHGGGIDLHLSRPLTDAERGELLDRLSAAVTAWREGERRGDIPAGIERLVDGTQPGKMPWQRLLARYVGEARSRQDYSLTRPNQRWLLEDLLVPGPWSEGPGRVVVAVDTSASIEPPLLQAIANELARLHALLPDLTVLVADAEVHTQVPARELPAFLRRGRFAGGGGTSHRPVFAWIDRKRLQPDLFIGLTDLFSEFPKKKPAFPVLWIAPERHGRAPWGRIIEAAL